MVLNRKPTPTPGDALNASTVCLHLERGSWGARKKGSLATLDVTGLDARQVNLTKRLLGKDFFKAFRQIDRSIDLLIERHALPSHFRAGVYRVNVAAVKRIQKGLTSARTKLADVVDAMALALPQAIADMEAKSANGDGLGKLFERSDYPTADKLRASYHLDWYWLEPEQASSKVKSIAADVFDETCLQMQKIADDAATYYRAFLRQECKTFVDHLYDRLTPDADGKPKTFKPASVENLRSWLQNLSHRESTGDLDLHAIGKELADLMDGVNASSLRDDQALRESVATKLAATSTVLESMITKGGRAVLMDVA